MSENDIALPTPENKEFHTLLENCNKASYHFNWLQRKQVKLRQEMNQYPLISNRNSKIIELLKNELPKMDELINPIREQGYHMFTNPAFDYKEKDPLKALFATQHYTYFILHRTKLVEEDYKSCLENFRKIVSENKYLYTKNVSYLSITIALISLLVTFLTVITSIYIDNYFYFRLF